ncbi:radical SAM protein [Novosphingobium aquimarinum]|uniref:radical SAM protein n=1 Tax=Novosphingobium aquimarinum TaxID=2682494 RepID=UPI0012ECA4CB|nr:radical SAM protein [Novosphingobium aquimarinum]
MWSYYPELLAKPVPRYTSYPTAAAFSDAVGPTDFASALEGAAGDASLYLHIPFCRKVCWYCGCNTSAAGRTSRVDAYLDALHSEIALVAERASPDLRFHSIAFGGGSPNAISPIQFVRLIDRLTVVFGLVDPAFSIELDPRSLDEDWGPSLMAVGVSRASLGVQTFSPALQAAIGRIQPGFSIERATGMLRKSGVTSLNFDLMYGLPGQTLEDLQDSLDRTVALGADRIALFGYAHLPQQIARQRRIDGSALPDQQQRFAMAAFGYDFLVDEGYIPVGFDHFARPGDPLAQAAQNGNLRRNFQGFTEDQSDIVVGLGASAISSFPELLAQNDKNTGRYRMRAGAKQLATSCGVRRTPRDQAMARVVETLLCQGAAVLDAPPGPQLIANMRPYLERGLVDLTAEGLIITPSGLPYARCIAAQVIADLPENPARRFSAAI